MALNRLDQTAAEKERIRSMYQFERDLWAAELERIAGVDEAGRGPLAGPVVAAAVIFPREVFISGVNDSKRLSAHLRESLYDRILAAALSVGIGQASPQEIDQLNILQASLLAMKRAIDGLSVTPEHILVDGCRSIPEVSIPQMVLTRGDQRCFSIAAASIIAKVHRDRIMRDYHRIYPCYSFDRHKGYPTSAHVAAIARYGLCDIHRRSFRMRALS